VEILRFKVWSVAQQLILSRDSTQPSCARSEASNLAECLGVTFDWVPAEQLSICRDSGNEFPVGLDKLGGLEFLWQLNSFSEHILDLILFETHVLLSGDTDLMSLGRHPLDLLHHP
jgi:hypothetical protein